MSHIHPAFAVGVGLHEKALSGDDENDAEGGNDQNQGVLGSLDPQEGGEDDDIEADGDGHYGRQACP